jgi:hypothetical protein
MASGERDTAVERLTIPIIGLAGHGCGQNPAFSGLYPHPERPDLPRIMPWRGRRPLMRTQSAATKLLDHVDRWQEVYADDIATIHLRKPGTMHGAEPAVDPKAHCIRRRPAARLGLQDDVFSWGDHWSPSFVVQKT